jgi:hypothetical protein
MADVLLPSSAFLWALPPDRCRTFFGLAESAEGTTASVILVVCDSACDSICGACMNNNASAPNEIMVLKLRLEPRLFNMIVLCLERIAQMTKEWFRDCQESSLALLHVNKI